MTRAELEVVSNEAIRNWKPEVEDGYAPKSFRECALMQDAYIAGFLAGRDAAAEVVDRAIDINEYEDQYINHAERTLIEIKSLGEEKP